MEYLYFKFFEPLSSVDKPRKRTLKTIISSGIVKILSTFIPLANPNFDKGIEKVACWLVEYNITEDFPNREIGLDKNGKALLIMPWKENYGYWTDNDNIKLDDFFTKLKATRIEKKDFEDHWIKFESENQTHSTAS